MDYIIRKLFVTLWWSKSRGECRQSISQKVHSYFKVSEAKTKSYPTLSVYCLEHWWDQGQSLLVEQCPTWELCKRGGRILQEKKSSRKKLDRSKKRSLTETISVQSVERSIGFCIGLSEASDPSSLSGSLSTSIQLGWPSRHHTKLLTEVVNGPLP